MADHAILSPSAASRWTRCPGSVHLAKFEPDTSSAYADEGTVAHMIAELCLRGGRDAKYYAGDYVRVLDGQVQLCPEEGNDTNYGKGTVLMVNDEMAEEVQKYLDYVRQASAGAELFTEERYDISHIVPECFGTSDTTILHPDGELHVVDLKFGRGVEVSAVENEQMMLYALGAVERFSLTHEITSVRMTVHQPRLNNVSEWMITIDELMQRAERFRAAGERAIQFHYDAVPTPEDFTPDAKACRFCPGKGNCEALTRFALTTMADDFVDLEAAGDTLPGLVDAATERVGAIDNDLLGKLLQHMDLVEGWAKAVRARAEAELLAGRDVYGHKLVEGRKGRREWVDEADAEATLKAMRLKKDEMYDFKVISPTTAEKLFKESPRRWDRVRDLIRQSQGKPSVAPADDPRPALVVAPENDFDDLTQPATDLV
ncbi:DUF2800 domain-containing protein [Parapusillimonas sp. JC17]|uniref:DUF2800 domain-containing protein n=1 Tax=Parapusillimonas sp. JC17 TaxID=3445768 RepID=UPI003F9F46A1